jgi:hypothetical protein
MKFSNIGTINFMHRLWITDIIPLLSGILEACFQIWPLRSTMIELIALVVCIFRGIFILFAKFVVKVMQWFMFIEYSPRPRAFGLRIEFTNFWCEELLTRTQIIMQCLFLQNSHLLASFFDILIITLQKILN